AVVAVRVFPVTREACSRDALKGAPYRIPGWRHSLELPPRPRTRHTAALAALSGVLRNSLNGSIFSRFPLPSPGIRLSRVPALPASQVGRPLCALLVERDADTRDMYSGFLRQCGFDIEEAQDG